MPTILAVMIHVPPTAIESALAWYSVAFPEFERNRSSHDDFEYLCAGSLHLEIVPADQKVTSGPCGTIVYWEARDFANDLNRLISIGATVYRGPMNIESDQAMCQVMDPWGNCIGLRGRRS